jgi:hypothetical protein
VIATAGASALVLLGVQISAVSCCDCGCVAEVLKRPPVPVSLCVGGPLCSGAD